jgi:hypothetical protein
MSFLKCIFTLTTYVSARRSALLLGVWLSLILAAAQMFAQANLGRVLGAVRDDSGGAVPGVTVSVIDADRGLERTAVTDEAGEYAFPGLTPGRKTIRAEFTGFKAFEQANIQLEVGQDVRVDVALAPGAVNETVRVTEAPPMLDTTGSSLGGTLSNQAINDLPLNGRNFENLLTLRPGVTIYPGGGAYTQSTNGLRGQDQVYMLDGLVNDEPFTGQSIYNGAGGGGDAGTILSIDAIQEFQTEQNPRAEFGWKPGSVVNVGIKSGSNSAHGSAFAYGRDGSWDAKNYFTPAASNPTCQVSPASCNPPLGLEQFGGTVGGPIVKDKLFYFFNYEDQRYTVGSPYVTNSPVACSGGSAGCGLTSPDPSLSLVDACNSVSAASRSVLSLKLAGLTSECGPASNFPGLFPKNLGTTPGNPTSYVPGLSNTNQVDGGLTKVDYHINPKNTLSGMYFFSQGDGLFNDNAWEVSPLWETNQFMRAQVGSGSWIWVPNPQVVNELRVGYSHYYQTYLSADENVNPTAYGLNTGVTNPLYFGLPQISFNSFNSNNFQLGASHPKIFTSGVPQFLDQVSYLRGKHAFKFGGEVMQRQTNATVTNDAKGPIKFKSLSSFFEGDPTRGTILIGDAARDVTSWAYAAFAQDDWRATRNLTINIGVRYELNTVFKEANNLIGSFDPTQGLEQVGKQISSPYNGDHTAFAPRLGLAWDIQGNGRTVLRAGAGIFYEQLSYDTFLALHNELGVSSVPTGATTVVNGVSTPGSGNINLATVTVPGSGLNWNGSSVGGPTIYPLSTLSAQCGDGLGGDPSPCATYGVERNLRAPYVSQWNIGLQRALTHSMSLEVAYVGNHGTKLLQTTNLNASPVGSSYTPAELAYCNTHIATFGTSPYNCDPSDANPALAQAARPYTVNGKFPYLGDVYYLGNASSSNYNGLQVVLTQRVSHGLSFTAGYTYSHALDDASDNYGVGQQLPLINTNLHSLYGDSDWDIRHRFTFMTNYALPGLKSPGQILQGWSLNSIVTVQTGEPWSIQDTSNDFSGTNIVSAAWGAGERWDFVGNPSDFTVGPNPIPCASGVGTGLPGCNAPIPTTCIKAATALGPGALNSLYNIGCYFNGNSVLIPPALGTYGTMGRNIFRGTGFTNVDFSVTKTFRFRDFLTAQFRAEVFNLFNHPTFANPEGGPTGYFNNDPSAGYGMGCGCITPDTASGNPVLGSGGARAVQLGLKMIF